MNLTRIKPEHLTQFTPSPAIVGAAEKLFVLMAHLAHVHPIVEAYENAILAEHQWRKAEKWCEGEDSRPVIADRRGAFLLNDEDHTTFVAHCQMAQARHGLSVSKPNHCPLLEAEQAVRESERAFLDAIATCEEFKTLTYDNLLQSGQNNLSLSIALFLEMVAPHVRPASEILKEFKTTTRD